MRISWGIVASLMVLAGCQTTGGSDSARMRAQNAQKDFLLNAMSDVCVANLGDETAIDAAARKISIKDPSTEDAYIGIKQVTATIYPIGLNGRFAGVIAQRAGETCGVITVRSINFPDTLATTYDLEMEDMQLSSDFVKMKDLYYGFSNDLNLPVKQFVQITDDGKSLDAVEFMTPTAFRAESELSANVIGMLKKQNANPDVEEKDIFLQVLDDVCLPNIGDLAKITKAAERLSGVSGIKVNDPRTKPFADELLLYFLSLKPDGEVTFIGISDDASLCGYWAVNLAGKSQDVFKHYDLVRIESGMVEAGFVELGFSAEENLAVFQVATESEEQTVYVTALMKRKAYAELKFPNLPQLPWDL